MSHSIEVNTKQVCPIMKDLFNANLKQGLDIDSDQKSSEVAVAHLAMGLIFLAHVGGDRDMMLNAAEMCAEAFGDAVARTQERDNDQG